MAASSIRGLEAPAGNKSASFEVEDPTSNDLLFESDEPRGRGLPRIVGNSFALRQVLGMVRIVPDAP
jgi:hypothetical protein